MPRYSNKAQYTPAILPKDLQDPQVLKFLMVALEENFERVLRAFNAQHDYPKLTEEPEKLIEGMVRYADGVNWNPGDGRGLYVYDGTIWKKLHA